MEERGEVSVVFPSSPAAGAALPCHLPALITQASGLRRPVGFTPESFNQRKFQGEQLCVYSGTKGDSLDCVLAPPPPGVPVPGASSPLRIAWAPGIEL